MINLTCKLSKSESFKAQAAVFLRTFTDPCVASTGAAMLFSLHLDGFASCIPSHNVSSCEGFTLGSMRSPLVSQDLQMGQEGRYRGSGRVLRCARGW